jgi:hypothetical protein
MKTVVAVTVTLVAVASRKKELVTTTELSYRAVVAATIVAVQASRSNTLLPDLFVQSVGKFIPQGKEDGSTST